MLSAYHYAPRIIPFPVKLMARLGSRGSVFGWFFFGVMMPIGWLVISLADMPIPFPEKAWKTASGRIINFKKTNYKENKKNIYKVEYSYKDSQNNIRFGTSYSFNTSYIKGEKVDIIYPWGLHRYSKIKGYRTQPYHPLILVALIFPLIGLFIIIPNYIASFKHLKLIKTCIIKNATLIKKEESPYTPGVRNSNTYTYIFRTDDGKDQEIKFHHPETFQSKERVFYPPDKPEQALPLRNGWLVPLINEYNKVETPSKLKLFAHLFVPMLAICGHGMYFLITYVLPNVC